MRVIIFLIFISFVTGCFRNFDIDSCSSPNEFNLIDTSEIWHTATLTYNLKLTEPNYIRGTISDSIRYYKFRSSENDNNRIFSDLGICYLALGKSENDHSYWSIRFGNFHFQNIDNPLIIDSLSTISAELMYFDSNSDIYYESSSKAGSKIIINYFDSSLIKGTFQGNFHGGYGNGGLVNSVFIPDGEFVINFAKNNFITYEVEITPSPDVSDYKIYYNSKLLIKDNQILVDTSNNSLVFSFRYNRGDWSIDAGIEEQIIFEIPESRGSFIIGGSSLANYKVYYQRLCYCSFRNPMLFDQGTISGYRCDDHWVINYNLRLRDHYIDNSYYMFTFNHVAEFYYR